MSSTLFLHLPTSGYTIVRKNPAIDKKPLRIERARYAYTVFLGFSWLCCKAVGCLLVSGKEMVMLA